MKGQGEMWDRLTHCSSNSLRLERAMQVYRAEWGKRWDRHQRFRRRLRRTRRTNTAKEKMRTSLVPKFRMYPETTFRFRSEGRKEQVQKRVPAVEATVLR